MDNLPPFAKNSSSLVEVIDAANIYLESLREFYEAIEVGGDCGGILDSIYNISNAIASAIRSEFNCKEESNVD